jgi:hypothetical protein
VSSFRHGGDGGKSAKGDGELKQAKFQVQYRPADHFHLNQKLTLETMLMLLLCV